MSSKKAKSFNSQVYSIACKRLKLKRREKIIFFRLLGFLIRNDKPFPYSVNALSEITGYSRRSIFECINLLENLRLIERIGFTNMVRYQKGRILNRICSLVQKRIDLEQFKSSTLVQKLHEFTLTSAETAYKKTSSSLKRKEGVGFYDPNYQEYAGGIKSNIKLGLLDPETKILTYEEWLSTNDHANIKK